MGDTPTFNLVAIYEDSAAGRRARHFYETAIQELAECDFSLQLWSFEVLAIPEIGNAVARVAAEADFVISSTHGKAQLSVQIRHCLKKWLQLIPDHKPALIVLLNRRATNRRTLGSTLIYLRKLADRHAISFYAHANFGLLSS